MNTSEPKPRGEKPFVPGIYECGDCKDIIWSRYSGQYVGCKCGKSFIDDVGRYSRFGGACQAYIGLLTIGMLKAADKMLSIAKKLLWKK